MTMKLQDFDYSLDTQLIAQRPAERREQARLLSYDSQTGEITHAHFKDLVQWFKPGDVLVINNSKVIPARLHGKKPSGGAVEVFLLRQKTPAVWECLVRNRGRGETVSVTFDHGLTATVGPLNDGTALVRFNRKGRELRDIISKIGTMPLPPYIKEPAPADSRRYQTVYADAARSGSVAAPTAGLHFSRPLLKQIREMGVQIEEVTLHVGLGTFQPVTTEDINQHHLHSEAVYVPAATVRRLITAKAAGRRIIAVGTTSVRVLEGSVARYLHDACYRKIDEDINVFIRPGYRFDMVDALITNFHLPKSTLLMLVAALLEHKGIADGTAEIKQLYMTAQRYGYRFFSYGDAMFIH